MKALFVLDIIARGVFLPGLLLWIVSLVPGFKEDVKSMIALFKDGNEIKVRKKRKTIQTQTMPVVIRTNSFSKYLVYSDDFIVPQK